MEIDGPSFTDSLLTRFEAAAGKAAVTELKLRILAEVIPALEPYAHDDKLHEVETRIFDWFASIGEPVSAVEQNIVITTRRFRNKLLHGELHTARANMHQLGAPQRTGGVLRMTFDDAGSQLSQLEAALRDRTMTPIALTTTKDAGIAGWLMDMGLAGDFESAYTICENASALIDDLIDRANAYHIRKHSQNKS